MKHANAEDLLKIESLLSDLSKVRGLQEKKRGVFYVKSRAFLHFHEDKGKLYADLRCQGTEFERFPVVTQNQQTKLLQMVTASQVES